jgi:hypothetical protein
VLPTLEGRHAGLVYFFLYDSAWHNTTPVVAISIARLANITRLDTRVVQKCIAELCEKGHIDLCHAGTSRSRTDIPIYSVPLAAGKFAGPWVPVPRFIKRYLTRYPKAIILLSVLATQHINGLNYSWRGAASYAKELGWSQESAYRALRTLAQPKLWRRERTGLPRPLTFNHVKKESGEIRRQFQVRFFCWSKREGSKPHVWVDREFPAFFSLPLRKNKSRVRS